MILSKTFDTLKKTLTGVEFSLPKSSFFLKIGLSSASFKLPGKHPFSNDKLMIFVIRERCLSSVTLSMSAGMSATDVTLESSIL